MAHFNLYYSLGQSPW